MKTSFTGFWRRNLAFFRLAVLTNLEYRFNFLTDAILQPVVTALIELTLWIAIFATATTNEIGGFTKEYYLAYVMWTAFVARITSNWMYEFRMTEEIETGTVNSLIVRPTSFYEYYLSQFLGYKAITSGFSLIIPLFACYFLDFPLEISRVPIAMLLIVFYLIFVHTMSFFVATIAFHLNRVHSLTMAKNLALWLFTGELLPLDLLPAGIREVIINLPFASAVYLPVGYITNRIPSELFYQGFINTAIGLGIMGVISGLMWRWGMSKYVGTGA